MYTIYKYENVVNRKVYIGQTSLTVEQRAQTDGNNYKQCPRFYNAIKKYGWDNFVVSIIDTAETPEMANELEIYYIALYRSTEEEYGYNISLGGLGKGSMSEATREKISEKAKERYKDKTKNPMYGREHTEETKRKMSDNRKGILNPMYGTKWNETQRKLCGTKGKKLNISEERRDELRERFRAVGKTVGLKKVLCIEDNVIFNSITEAAKVYGVSKQTLSGHLNGRQHSCVGKHFKFTS